MTTTTNATHPAIVELRDTVAGRVIAPDDADYDEARHIKYADPSARPAAVVRVADALDVARVIAVAKDHGLELAVRSGGHSGAGHSTTDGGLVIDLRDLDAIDLDVGTRTVWAGAGLTAGALSSALSEHGLVIGFGDTGSVGIGGITLGGGAGYLVRRFGLSIDNLLAAEIVTADGQVREIDATSEPDLFWAIRGGGGNFGVVTRFRYQLHELPQVVGGMLMLPASAATVRGFLDAAEAAPEALSTIANVMPAPPMPFVDEAWHGKLVIMALMTYAGGADEAGPVLAPFRALAEPIVDFLRPITYAEMFPPEDPGYEPVALNRTFFMDHVDDDLAQLIVDRVTEHVASTDAQMAVAQLRVLGGAVARVPADATAYAHRDARIMGNVAAMVATRDQLAAEIPWLDGFAAELRGDDQRAYVNFVTDEGAARVHDAYPAATWDRLASIKRRYDPDNLFHRNQNVPPA